MITKCGTALFFGALAAFIVCGTVRASAIDVPGAGDPFTLAFDENGNATIDLRDGNGPQPDSFVIQADPNASNHLALTYLLDGIVGVGIVDVLDINGNLSDAISFYNIGDQGYMAYYSGDINGGTLADIISAGFVPLSDLSVTDVGDTFAYFSGGVPLANNDYYGISGGNQTPDGGSTLALLGGALVLVGAFSRKLRQNTI